MIRRISRMSDCSARPFWIGSDSDLDRFRAPFDGGNEGRGGRVLPAVVRKDTSPAAATGRRRSGPVGRPEVDDRRLDHPRRD